MRESRLLSRRFVVDAVPREGIDFLARTIWPLARYVCSRRPRGFRKPTADVKREKTDINFIIQIVWFTVDRKPTEISPRFSILFRKKQ